MIITTQNPPLIKILIQLNLHISLEMLNNFLGGKAKYIVAILVLLMNFRISFKMVLIKVSKNGPVPGLRPLQIGIGSHRDRFWTFSR
jgi:hypothetical protein